MTTRTILHSILALVLLVSCDHGVLWEDPPYLVHWIDSSENRLVYDLGQGSSIVRVSGHVTAVGSNAEYVVAEQLNPTTNVTAFFYIEKAKDRKYSDERQITQGPYSKMRFEKITQDLGLPGFTKRF